MPQRIGRYRNRVIIQQRTEPRDAAGEPVAAWSQFAIAWMGRRGTGRPEKYEAGTAYQAEQQSEFRTHFKRGIDAKMRLLVPGKSAKLTVTTAYEDDFTTATSWAGGTWPLTATGWVHTTSTDGGIALARTTGTGSFNVSATNATLASGHTYTVLLTIRNWTQGGIRPYVGNRGATNIQFASGLSASGVLAVPIGLPVTALLGRVLLQCNTNAVLNPDLFDGEVTNIEVRDKKTATATTIQVDSADGFPLEGKFRIRRGSELMLVTGGNGTTTWEVTRGVDGTTAAIATQGTKVTLMQVYDVEGVDVDWERGAETLIRARLYDGVN